MTDLSEALSRRDFVQGALSGAVLMTGTAAALATAGDDPDKAAVLAQIPKMHAENVKRLQDWIALPSIAAENRNMKEGCQMMIDLLKEAGFQSATMMPTDGQPGVFATLNAGAPRTDRLSGWAVLRTLIANARGHFPHFDHPLGNLPVSGRGRGLDSLRQETDTRQILARAGRDGPGAPR